MPKEGRKRISTHEPSATLHKRQFTIGDHAIEHEVGSGASAPLANPKTSLTKETPVDSDFGGIEVLEQQPVVLRKKEKHALKRETLLQRLEARRSPHSKSHLRRMKRKAREQIASGLGEMQSAISTLFEENHCEKGKLQCQDTDYPAVSNKLNKQSRIGKGKGVSLSKAQRKRALALERLRHPLILTNTAFSSSPFETIRIHAQNTLVKRQSPIL